MRIPGGRISRTRWGVLGRPLRVQGSSCDPPWTECPASTTVAADLSAVAIPFILPGRPAGKSHFPGMQPDAALRPTRSQDKPVAGQSCADVARPQNNAGHTHASRVPESAAMLDVRNRSGARWGGFAEHFVADYSAGSGAGTKAGGSVGCGRVGPTCSTGPCLHRGWGGGRGPARGITLGLAVIENSPRS